MSLSETRSCKSTMKGVQSTCMQILGQSVVSDIFYQDLPDFFRPRDISDKELKQIVKVLRKGNSLLKLETELLASKVQSLGIPFDTSSIASYRRSFALSIGSGSIGSGSFNLDSPRSTSSYRFPFGSSSSQGSKPSGASETSVNLLCRKPYLKLSYRLNMVQDATDKLFVKHNKLKHDEILNKTSLNANIQSLQQCIVEVNTSRSGIEIWYEHRKGQLNKLTGERVIAQMEDIVKNWSQILRTLRMKHGKLQTKLRILKIDIKNKSILAQSVVPSDFEHIRIQNIEFKEELNQKNQLCLEHKYQINEINAKLNSVKVTIGNKVDSVHNLERAETLKKKELDHFQRQYTLTLQERELKRKELTDMKNLVSNYVAPSSTLYIEEKARIGQLERRTKMLAETKLVRRTAQQTFLQYIAQSREAVHQEWVFREFLKIMAAKRKHKQAELAVTAATKPVAAIARFPAPVSVRAPPPREEANSIPSIASSSYSEISVHPVASGVNVVMLRK